MKFSIVSTLYRSGLYLDEFHRRMTETVQKLTKDYEIIYVNDGCPEDSQAVAQAICDSDPRTVLIELSRNFGHHKAMMTGLDHASGELVWLIDCDLEEDPEWLHSFHQKMFAVDADVVYGVQSRRKGGVFERWAGIAFYKLFELLSSCRLEPNLLTVRLMSRRYVQQLVAHRERELCLSGLWSITGFRQVSASVVKKDKCKSSYSFRRKLSVALNAITSFSSTPLHCIFVLGVLILGISIGASALVVLNWILVKPQSGWTSIMVSIWFLGGLILFSLGILGVYLGKIFSEVKQRPYSIIRSIYNQHNQGDLNDEQQYRRAS